MRIIHLHLANGNERMEPVPNPYCVIARQSLHFQQAVRLLRSLLSLAMALLAQAHREESMPGMQEGK
jgi:hypothetical protein